MKRISDKRFNKAMEECYIALYKAATPSADFLELVANADIDEDGKKDIYFDRYYLHSDEMDVIVKATIKEYKMTKKDAQTFSVSMYLGASPTSKES
jgi:hypothetical protein